MRKVVPVCPNCNSPEVREIVYGYPAPETIEKAARGEIELGGCIFRGPEPRWRCRDCSHEWGVSITSRLIDELRKT